MNLFIVFNNSVVYYIKSQSNEYYNQANKYTYHLTYHLFVCAYIYV